jgi:hypothetical protein
VGDEDRDSILSRRARFIAAALATLTATASACDGCNEVVVVDDDDGVGGQPEPCLSPKPPDGGGGEGGVGGVPQPCLSQVEGGGGQGGGFGGQGQGGFGGAQPCLVPKRR